MIGIILFYECSFGKQARLSFSDRYRHCNVITFDGDVWLNVDMDSSGIHTRRLSVPSSNSLLRHLKLIPIVTDIIVVEISTPKIYQWSPWWVRSCNELVRYLTNIDIGFTFNPRHLYKKVLKYDGKSNYKIIDAWRRPDGNIRR